MGIRIAAIDIGSNAIRISIGENQKKRIKIIKTDRIPISLGRDVFTNGQISDENLLGVTKAFINFQHLLINYKVKFYKAVATSALRDAKNNFELIDLIHSTSHIQIDLIDGIEEGQLIHLVVSHIYNLSKKMALLIDIGGGSVEFIISNKGILQKILSLPIGTVRLIKSKDLLNQQDIRNEIQKQIAPLKVFEKKFKNQSIAPVLIGTGGNVKSLNRLSNRIFRAPNKDLLSFAELELLEKILFGYTNNERIEKLGLRPDRSDVILPAVLILQEVMKNFNINEIQCPNVGLKDGILIEIIKNLKSS